MDIGRSECRTRVGEYFERPLTGWYQSSDARARRKCCVYMPVPRASVYTLARPAIE